MTPHQTGPFQTFFQIKGHVSMVIDFVWLALLPYLPQPSFYSVTCALKDTQQSLLMLIPFISK